MQLRLRLLHHQPTQCMLLEYEQQLSEQEKQQQQRHQLDQQRWLEGQRLTHRTSSMAAVMQEQGPVPSGPWLPPSPKCSDQTETFFSVDNSSTSGASSVVSRGSSNGTAAISRGGNTAGGLAAAGADSMLPSNAIAAGSCGTHVLQKLVAERIGLAPTEEGKQMLHYVIPQVRDCYQLNSWQASQPNLDLLASMLFPPLRAWLHVSALMSLTWMCLLCAFVCVCVHVADTWA